VVLNVILSLNFASWNGGKKIGVNLTFNDESLSF